MKCLKNLTPKTQKQLQTHFGHFDNWTKGRSKSNMAFYIQPHWWGFHLSAFAQNVDQNSPFLRIEL